MSCVHLDASWSKWLSASIMADGAKSIFFSFRFVLTITPYITGDQSFWHKRMSLDQNLILQVFDLMRADRWKIASQLFSSWKPVIGLIHCNTLKNHPAANLLCSSFKRGGVWRLISLGCLITHTALQAHQRRSPWLFCIFATTRRDQTAENTEQH